MLGMQPDGRSSAWGAVCQVEPLNFHYCLFNGLLQSSGNQHHAQS